MTQPSVSSSTDGTGLRGTAVTARVGLWLGVAIAVCFVTGLLSHFIQHPQPWFFWPTRPVWLYRVTQGLHVVSGIAAIPLIVVKLWSVWPKLFERPVFGGLVRQIERVSILVLVGSMLFQRQGTPPRATHAHRHDPHPTETGRPVRHPPIRTQPLTDPRRVG